MIEEYYIYQSKYCKNKNFCTPTENFAQAYDWLFFQPHHKKDSKFSHLIPALKKYANCNLMIHLNICGYATFAAHKWVDRIRARKVKYYQCNILFCDCTLTELDQNCNTRYFRSAPFSEPPPKKGRFLQPLEKDKEILTKVWLLASSLTCGDLSQKNSKVPKLIDQHTEGTIALNANQRRTYSGRLLRHKSVVNPTRHIIHWIFVDSQLIKLAIREAH